MALLLEQIQALVRDKPRKKELDRAIVHQNRLKFHTETELLKSELSPYYNDFVGWICTEKPEILPKDKIERFKQLLTCPLSTVQLTEAIRIALSRVHEGQDAFCRYDFEDAEMLADWQDYRDDEFWKNEGMQAALNAIDSVWVVDLPSEQEGDKPEPKNLLIDIQNVIDINCTPRGDCEWVIFSVNDKLYVYDDESICVFEYIGCEDCQETGVKNGKICVNCEGKGKVIGGLLSEFFHELEYCPAKMFWSEFLNSKNFINHKAPLTNVLAELDWLLVHKTFKKYMDVANSFPILVKYQSGQDYTDLTPTDNKGRDEGEVKTRGNKLVGPGTVVEVPIPLEGQPDLMTNPLAWVSPDIASLKFHVTEDERLTDYIYKTSVGLDEEPENDQAKNEKQVLASFENQSIILRRLANNFEKIQSFADHTLIFLRYGQDVTVSIDYGSKFFLKTAEDLTKEKESFAGDDVMLDANTTELIETKFRNDSGGKIRAKVINDLDPLPGKNIDEAIKIKDKGGISDTAFRIKAQLMNYVRRFEREQLPISEFMKDGEYFERVNLIKKEFLKYETEDNDPGEPESEGDDSGTGSALLPRSDDERENRSKGPNTSNKKNRGKADKGK